MTITAQSIIAQAHELLQDPTGGRWPATELVQHLNDGQRALVEYRPERFAVAVPTALVAGPRQTIPDNCARLLEVPRNTSGAAIRPVDRGQIDAVEPGWYTKPPSTTIQHTMVDAREHNVFYVYPPAALGASVELVYAAWPTDVPAPAGATAATVTGNIGVDDTFKNALLHFCLYRAYAKDAEFGGNAALSAGHYQLFTSNAGVVAPPAAAQE